MTTFGPFNFDLATGTLSQGGTSIPLSHRAALLLQTLLEAQGRPITKSALLDAAWPGMVVEENNLTVQIAALRKAIGEEWIVTVPRVGYRLRLPETVAPEPPKSRLPVIAVLPFQNLSGDFEQAYFAGGVVDDIITALSRFRLFVTVSGRPVSAGLPADPAEAARALGADYLLTGSIRRAGDTLRISAQLVDGATGAHIWAQNFDGTSRDVFAFQDHITEGVATRIEPSIRAAELARIRRENRQGFAAYDIYLRAQNHILAETEADNLAAHRLLTQALEIEPDNGVLLAHAAWVIEHRITMGWPPFGPDDRALCTELARRGLDHADGNPQVMTHCGMALLQGSREYAWGLEVVLAAARANPNHLIAVTAAGVALLHCGPLDQALAMFSRASDLSPLDPFAHICLCGTAHIHIIWGDCAAALELARRSKAINANFDPTYWMLTAAHAHLGQMEEARKSLADLLRLVPGQTVTRIRNGQPAFDPTRMAAVLDGLRLAGLPES